MNKKLYVRKEINLKRSKKEGQTYMIKSIYSSDLSSLFTLMNKMKIGTIPQPKIAMKLN